MYIALKNVKFDKLYYRGDIISDDVVNPEMGQKLINCGLIQKTASPEPKPPEPENNEPKPPKPENNDESDNGEINCPEVSETNEEINCSKVPEINEEAEESKKSGSRKSSKKG